MTVEKLLNIVVTLHIAGTTWMLMNSVSTFRRRTATSLLRSLLSIVAIKKSGCTNQLNTWQWMVLWAGTIEFYFHLVMTHIMHVFLTLPTMISSIQKPTATICLSIQTDHWFAHVVTILCTWTTALPANLFVMSISKSSMIKYNYGPLFLWGGVLISTLVCQAQHEQCCNQWAFQKPKDGNHHEFHILPHFIQMVEWDVPHNGNGLLEIEQGVKQAWVWSEQPLREWLHRFLLPQYC